jgi:hypothetical protein
MKPVFAALLLLPTVSRGATVPASSEATPLAAESYWAPVLNLYPRPGSLHGRDLEGRIGFTIRRA